ncbi:MAG: replication-relaxation family protein [Chloroflexota bacterium]
MRRKLEGVTLNETKKQAKQKLTKVKIEILATVLKHRLLTADQIQKRCLPLKDGQSPKGRQEYTRKLLRDLFNNKLLLRRKLIQPDLGNNPYVYAPTWSAAQAVADAYGTTTELVGYDPHDKVITWTNENLFHLLRENDCHYIFEQSAALSGIELREWHSDRTLARDKASRRVKYTGPHGGSYEKTLIPDGLYVFGHSVEVDGRTGTVLTRLFLEVDMGTQTITQRNKTLKHPQRTWEHKVRSYMAYFQPSGLCEQHYQTTNARVLVLTTSELRLKRMMEATERVGGTDRFWFATFEQFTPESALTQPIYWVAGSREKEYALIELFA